MTVSSLDLLNAVAALQKPDGVIGFPTDTVYGLGCLATHEQAIEKIYALKERELHKPLILMSHQMSSLEPYLGEVTDVQLNQFNTLTSAHWPGALTLVMPKSSKVPDAMTQGIETVGIRIPNIPFFSDLMELLGDAVLATTSANRSGADNTMTAAAVFKTFGSNLDCLLMDDSLSSDQASTVAAIESDGIVRVLRQGTITLS